MHEVEKHYTKSGATCRMMLSLAPELKQAIVEEAERQKKTQTLLVNQLLSWALRPRKESVRQLQA